MAWRRFVAGKKAYPPILSVLEWLEGFDVKVAVDWWPESNTVEPYDYSDSDSREFDSDCEIRLN